MKLLFLISVLPGLTLWVHLDLLCQFRPTRCHYQTHPHSYTLNKHTSFCWPVKIWLPNDVPSGEHYEQFKSQGSCLHFVHRVHLWVSVWVWLGDIRHVLSPTMQTPAEILPSITVFPPGTVCASSRRDETIHLKLHTRPPARSNGVLMYTTALVNEPGQHLSVCVVWGGFLSDLQTQLDERKKSWLVSGTKKACRDLLTRYFQIWNKPFEKCLGKHMVNKVYSVPQTTLDMPQSTEQKGKPFHWCDVRPCRGLICSDLSHRCFANVAACVSVVHDQHRPHLQPLEKLRDSLLCERAAGLLWRHGLACQHQWCKEVAEFIICYWLKTRLSLGTFHLKYSVRFSASPRTLGSVYARLWCYWQLFDVCPLHLWAGAQTPLGFFPANFTQIPTLNFPS